MKIKNDKDLFKFGTMKVKTEGLYIISNKT